MIGETVDRSAVGQWRSQMVEEIAKRKDRLVTSNKFERDAGFIQGLEAAYGVMDEIITARNNERANPQGKTDG